MLITQKLLFEFSISTSKCLYTLSTIWFKVKSCVLIWKTVVCITITGHSLMSIEQKKSQEFECIVFESIFK